MNHLWVYDLYKFQQPEPVFFTTIETEPSMSHLALVPISDRDSRLKRWAGSGNPEWEESGLLSILVYVLQILKWDIKQQILQQHRSTMPMNVQSFTVFCTAGKRLDPSTIARVCLEAVPNPRFSTMLMTSFEQPFLTSWGAFWLDCFCLKV